MNESTIFPARSVRMVMLFVLALLAALYAIQTNASPAGESPGPYTAQLVYDQVPLVASDAANGANFGYAVAIDGNTLVIGAYLANSDGKEYAGAAYVFTRPALGSRQWTQIARLSAADGAASDHFGAAVAIGGDTIAVSATHADINGNTNQGAVYLFSRNQGGSNKWGQVKKLLAANGTSLDEFGYALALTGDELLVGTPAADANGYIRNGAVYIYRRDQGGAGNWGEAGVLFDPNGRDSDNFGYDLAADGNWLVVGADRADVTGLYENDGAALLFTRANPGADWTFVKRLIASDTKPNERFGAGVAIDGDRVLVGAPAADRNSQFSVGKAYLFGRNQGGAGNWGLVKLLTASNGQGFDSYGTAVAMDGDTAYVAANKGDMTLVDEGAIYVYQKDQGGASAWGEAVKLGAAGGAPNGNFGQAIVHDGDALVVGANLAESASGRAYVFTPAAPPQISRTYLPVAFDIFFQPTGTITSGGVVTGPDGVKLGAVGGALDNPLPVSIEKAIPPALPVPDRATAIGETYRLAAARDIAQPLDKSFILALPVPAGADTGHLAVAVHGSTASLLDMDNPDGHFWRFVPGIYDPANRLLLAQFPSLASAGEIVALVEHPDMPSPPRGSTRAASEANSVKFVAACTDELTCNGALVDEFEDELLKQYTAFEFYGYGMPRMVGTNPNVSINPPQLGSPNQTYFALLFNKTQPGCTDEGGKPAYAGIYAPDRASLYICVANGTTSLSDFEKKTVRHEYFHALQYSYDNVLLDWMSRAEEDWIIEGMAEVVINSGWDWARSGDNDIRPVDKSLKEEEDLLAYRTEDFWAFYGRNRASGAGVERLQPILLAGSTFQDVFAHTGWAEDYWLWVRNQAIEKNDDMDGALVNGKCKFEEAAVSRLYTLDVSDPYSNPLVGKVDPLSAAVVEIIFPADWAGREVMIMAGALPTGQPPPAGFEYKIYRTPWPNCSSTPDNVDQRYKIIPGERYFVLFANWLNQSTLRWWVGYE